MVLHIISRWPFPWCRLWDTDDHSIAFSWESLMCLMTAGISQWVSQSEQRLPWCPLWLIFRVHLSLGFLICQKQPTVIHTKELSIDTFHDVCGFITSFNSIVEFLLFGVYYWWNLCIHEILHRSTLTMNVFAFCWGRTLVYTGAPLRIRLRPRICINCPFIYL